MYVKLPAIFPIVLMLVGVVLTTLGIKKAIKQPPGMGDGGLADRLPGHLLLVHHPGQSSGWLSFTLGLLKNWVSPSFYIRWIIFAGGLVDLGVAFISFVGVWLLPKKARIIPLALWVGYILYGLAFSYHITTHEYYSIP